MAHWLRDKLLAGRTSDGTVGRPRHYWLWSCSIGFACMILLAVLFHGCEQRALVRPTPQMDTDSQFWIRVLLASNATECSLASPSAMNVSQGRVGPALPAAGHVLGPLHRPARISLSNGRLTLGDTVLPGSEVILNPQSPY